MPAGEIIKNRTQLQTSPLRRKTLDIIEAGIKQVLPDTLMQTALAFRPSTRSLLVKGDEYILNGRIFAIGGGKAAGLMAETLEQIIGIAKIEAGLVIDKASPEEFNTHKIQVRQAGHPLPDARGENAVNEILLLKKQYTITGGDLILSLISGGASSLMPFPVEGVYLEDKLQVTRLLLSCGADIHQINTVRKHLSGIKGGRLAQYFAPAAVISFILSDVIGNDLSVIASGLTCPDPSTYSEAWAVLETYGILNKVPRNVIAILQKGCRGEIPETPKSLNNVHNYIIGDVEMALQAMAQIARDRGFNPLIVSSQQVGNTDDVARQRAREILDARYEGYDALLIGGETTPVLPDKHGKGGRNQQYAARTLPLLEDYPGDWVLACVGTDGSDYIPDVAGAIVDKKSLQDIKAQDPDFQTKLDAYDSNTLLGYVNNSLVITGNTHTNVGDIIVYLLQAGSM